MIKLICVGKLKEKALLSLQQEYLKRLTSYHKIEIIEVKDVSLTNKENSKQIKMVLDQEAESVLAKIKDEFVILLDLHGQSFTSEEFATLIDSTFTNRNSNIVFIIGGSLGVGEKLIKRSNIRLNISKFTFTHQMCRILILEQIYRSFKILNNEVYHK